MKLIIAQTIVQVFCAWLGLLLRWLFSVCFAKVLRVGVDSEMRCADRSYWARVLAVRWVRIRRQDFATLHLLRLVCMHHSWSSLVFGLSCLFCFFINCCFKTFCLLFLCYFIQGTFRCKQKFQVLSLHSQKLNSCTTYTQELKKSEISVKFFDSCKRCCN